MSVAIDLTVNGERATDIRVFVGYSGPWFADVVFEEAPNVTGAVVLKIGSLELHGITDASNEGTHGLQRRARVIGGKADGWSARVVPKAYHADNGVQASSVAIDAAREVGEQLGSPFTPSSASIGIDYVRSAGPASRVLEDVIGSSTWWVGYDGLTYVGTRSASTPAAGSYQVLSFDPITQMATIGVDDASAVVIGSVLTDVLDAPQPVREIMIAATQDGLRLHAWCGESPAEVNRIAALLRSIVGRSTDRKLFGSWRYRVIRMNVDRVELQAIRRDAGLPDVLPVSMCPGMAGLHAQLTPSAEVLVEFIEGDRTMPRITHFAGKDGNGWSPVSLVLDATTDIKIGANATQLVALSNLVATELGKIQTALSTHVHAGVTAGAASSGTAASVYTPASVAATKAKAE